MDIVIYGMALANALEILLFGVSGMKAIKAKDRELAITFMALTVVAIANIGKDILMGVYR